MFGLNRTDLGGRFVEEGSAPVKSSRSQFTRGHQSPFPKEEFQPVPSQTRSLPFLSTSVFCLGLVKKGKTVNISGEAHSALRTPLLASISPLRFMYNGLV